MAVVCLTCGDENLTACSASADLMCCSLNVRRKRDEETNRGTIGRGAHSLNIWTLSLITLPRVKRSTQRKSVRQRRVHPRLSPHHRSFACCTWLVFCCHYCILYRIVEVMFSIMVTVVVLLLGEGQASAKRKLVKGLEPYRNPIAASAPVRRYKSVQLLHTT